MMRSMERCAAVGIGGIWALTAPQSNMDAVMMANRKDMSFRPIRKVIEQRHTIRFGPYTDFSGVLECVVVPFERLLTVKSHGEMIILKFHSQRVPLITGDFHARAFLLRPTTLNGV